jgi:MFS family permease
VSGPDGSPRAGRVVATAVAALVCAGLPVFLVGALSPWITAELGLGAAAVGSVVGTFFLASAVMAVPAGAIVDRVGASAGLRVGVLLSAVAAAAIGGLADGLAWLLASMVLASCAVPLVDTGSARAIHAAVPTERHGIAFGSKEAGVPGASLLAGIAVPVVAIQFGWRPAFLGAAVVATLVGLLLVPRGIDHAHRVTRSPASRPPTDPVSGSLAPLAVDLDEGVGTVRRARPVDGKDGPVDGPLDGRGRSRALLLLVLATAMAGAAATAAPAFLVPAMVSRGMIEGAAGMLLAVGSAAGISTRLVAGLVADRTRVGVLRLTTTLMAVGTLGLFALATGRAWATVPGAILALGAGWGWTGLAFLAAVQLAPARPAAAAGRILAGLMLGGAVGAAAFGWLVAGPGYPRAWQTAALAMAVGTLLSGLSALAHRASHAR